MTGYLGEGVASKEEASVGKKYGGITPKKPLISKHDKKKLLRKSLNNGRAFFDSADWALGKQGTAEGQKGRPAVESLRPKLQRTPHRQLPPRRPTCTTTGCMDSSNMDD